MNNLSNHTKLMNILIGLTMKIPHWPDSLRQLGYKVEIIEEKIPEVNPDLIFTSKKFNHSIIIDCKSRTIKENQVRKYLRIKEDPSILIRRGIVNVVHHKDYKVDSSFVSFSDLSNDELLIKNSMVVLHVVENSDKIERIDKTLSEFHIKEINKIFPINISEDDYPPYYLYPFDVQDRLQFASFILREILQFSLERITSFNIEKLLENIETWKYMSHSKKQEFKRVGNMILTEISKKLKGILKKEGTLWVLNLKRDIKSYQAFQKKCESLLKQFENLFPKQSLIDYLKNESS